MSNDEVKHMGTNSLYPFLIKNQREIPIVLKCNPIKYNISECIIDENIILRDHEI